MGHPLSKVFKWVGAIALAAVAVVATAGAAGIFAAGGLAAGFGAAAGIGGLSAAAFGAIASVSLIGAQYLLGSNQSSAGSNLPSYQAPQTGPAPTPIYRTLRQPEVPRSFIFGRTRTAGAFFFYETDTTAVTGAAPTTSTDKRIGKYLYSGIYVCDGPVDGFDGILCDDEAFAAGSTGPNGVSYTPDGNPNVFIPRDGIKFVKDPGYTQTGTQWVWTGSTWIAVPVSTPGTLKINECALIAFEPVNATLTGYQSYILNTLMTTYRTDDTKPNPMGGLWSPAHIGKGVTCLYTYASTTAIPTSTSRMKYFPNGFPEWSVVVRGARMYDPRDPSQSFLDPTTGRWSLYNSTWKFSENPAIIAGHFVSWLIDQGVTAITGVNWDSIARAADECDKLKETTHFLYPSGSSYEPFARVTAVFYFNTPPREFLGNLMAACDGTYGLDRQGKFIMWVGKWELPAVTFTEKDIGGFTEEFVESASEAMNEVHATYIEPRQNYQKFEAPIWQDLGSQNLVGKRIQSISLNMVPSPNQAYRIVQRMARRINGKKKLTINVGPRGMLAIKQRVVGVEAPNFGITGVWRVESLQPEITLNRWTMTLREIDEAVFADEPPPTDPVSALKLVNLGTLTAPQYFLVTGVSTQPDEGYVLIDANINQTQPDVAASNIYEAALIQEQTLQFDARYSVDSGSTWSAVGIELSNNVLRTPDLPSGTVVTIQTRWVSLSLTTSPWSESKTVSIP